MIKKINNALKERTKKPWDFYAIVDKDGAKQKAPVFGEHEYAIAKNPPIIVTKVASGKNSENIERSDQDKEEGRRSENGIALHKQNGERALDASYYSAKSKR